MKMKAFFKFRPSLLNMKKKKASMSMLSFVFQNENQATRLTLDFIF